MVELAIGVTIVARDGFWLFVNTFIGCSVVTFNKCVVMSIPEYSSIQVVWHSSLDGKRKSLNPSLAKV